MITCTFYVHDGIEGFCRSDKGLNKVNYVEEFGNEWGKELREFPLVAFELKGHADSAPHGEDLVCAATTALAMSSVTALSEILDLDIYYMIYDGYTRVEINNLENLNLRQFEDANLIIETLFLGLRQINESYDRKFLSLHTELYVAELGGQNND